MHDGRDQPARGAWLSEPVIKAAFVTGGFALIAALILASPSFLGRKSNPNETEGPLGAAKPPSQTVNRQEDLQDSERDGRAGEGAEGREVDVDRGGSTLHAASPEGSRAVSLTDRAPTSEPYFPPQSPGGGTISRTLREGGTTTIDSLDAVLGTEFKTTLGVQHVDVIFIVSGQPTRRLAAMSAGAEHEVEIGSRTFRLSVTAIDWRNRTVDVVLQPKEGSA